MNASTRPRKIDWPALLEIAARHVYAEKAKLGNPPTLRRLHYLLVSDESAVELGYENTQGRYKALSEQSKVARDAGTFPQLIDQTRQIHYSSGFENPSSLLNSAADMYQRCRSDLMPVQVVLLVEKEGVIPVLQSRFDWLDISAVRGYTSVSHAKSLERLARGSRETVGLYLGDYDPTGIDIDRALGERLPFPLRRIGLNRQQVIDLDLPPAAAKAGDSRTAAMVLSEGAAMQVELDALPTDYMLDLIAHHITDVSGVTLRDDGMPDWPDVDEQESADRQRLIDLAEEFAGGL